jgi:hypothetical protein
MATSAYLTGRKRYSRPQGILWSNNAGTLSNGLYVPNGIEVGATTEETDPDLLDQFIILSDHNRGEMQFNNQRIEHMIETVAENRKVVSRKLEDRFIKYSIN